MTIVAVLSQPLRQKEAGMYLQSRPEANKVVVSRFPDSLDTSVFPPDTVFRSWAPSEQPPPPSARASAALGRLKKWVRSGSAAGLRIDRWARSADWRLRYLDRFLTAVESGRGSRWDLENLALVEVIRSELEDEVGVEIAVFDVFDLPAAVSVANTHDCVVSVR